MKRAVVLIISLALVGLAFATNTSTLNQQGPKNTGTISQMGDDHEAYVDQYGTHYADVKQYGGDNNYADVDQGSAATPTSDAGYPSYAGDWIGGAYVEQDGNNNIAQIDDNKSSNGALIYQDGDNNEAYQILGSTQHKTTSWARMGVHINQVGSDNWAKQETISSYGCYGVQGMMIDQQGDGNYAHQYNVGGMQSDVIVKQIGSNNDYTVDVSATGIDPLGMTYAHKPAGNFIQYSHGRYCTQDIDIQGSSNHTAQYQEYTSWSVSGHNYEEIDIIGSNNNAAQGQIGEFNWSHITQTTDSNVAATSQTGAGTAEWDGNNATITQGGGDGNVGSIIQIK
jgi:hypothetical protein